MTSEICEIVITAPDAEWAAEFTRLLVDARLAACGHQFPIRSIYRWDGAVHDNAETRIALHTQVLHTDEIMRLTNQAHPYKVPCFIVEPIRSASPDYGDWVIDCTTPLGEV